MNTDGLFSGTSNPDNQSNAGTPDSGAAESHEITADGSRDQHDDNTSGDESTDGENVTEGNYFLYIGDSYDDEEGNELSSPPGGDDPMRLLSGGNTLDENQGSNT